MLCQDAASVVRQKAVEVLGMAFSYLPDKIQASQDILSLTGVEDRYGRMGAAKALGMAFRDVPDRNQASRALLTLTQDEDNYIRFEAAGALGRVFSDVTDRDQASQALLKLIMDENFLAFLSFVLFSPSRRLFLSSSWMRTVMYGIKLQMCWERFLTM